MEPSAIDMSLSGTTQGQGTKTMKTKKGETIPSKCESDEVLCV